MDCISDTLTCIDTIQCVIADTITVKRTILDSVTIDALKASQEFYSSAYNNLLCIISVFLVLITMILGFTTIILGYMNNKSEERLEKRILDSEKNLKKEQKKLSESQKEEFAKEITEKFSKEKENSRHIIITELKTEIEKIKSISYFTDSRDMLTYRTVKIGTQIWLAENLNFSVQESKPYDNNPIIGNKYGRLYDRETAKKACPAGWHLPTNEEWQILINFAGGDGIAGEKLKAVSGWDGRNNGTDEFNFSALPGGLFNHDADDFICLGCKGVWWSSTEINPNKIYSRGIDHSGSYVFQGTEKTANMLSIRCIKD